MHHVLAIFVLISFSQSLPVVHLVPHSHCDAGYRETFEDYYKYQVKSILDTVVNALDNITDRRFVWEEVSFFSRWWQDASEEQKATVKELVKRKQLEFIGGGWVMHDEAVNNAYAIVTQMSLGLRFLNETLGVRPQYEWHIDPFGHSLMMSELYHSLQYKAIVLNRIPNPIKQNMKKTKSLEFHWKSYTGASIFTHVLGQHYSTPSIFGLTISERAKSLVNTCQKRLGWYKTNQLLVPFGNDFAFVNASHDFQKMEEIVRHVNSNSDIYGLSMKFSTLDEYFSSVLSSGADFPEKIGGDFFTYIACYPCLSEHCDGIEGTLDTPCSFLLDDAYWSGFYTSKPAQKILTRKQEFVTFSLDVLNSFVFPENDSVHDALSISRLTLALLTHHDAITGTSFPSAYNDYNSRLLTAISLGEDAIGTLKKYALCKRNNAHIALSSDTMSLRELSDERIAVAVLFNPSGHEKLMYSKIELPPELCVQVMQISDSGDLVTVQSQQINSFLYIPVQISQLGLKVYFLKKIRCPANNTTQKMFDSLTVDNGAIQLEFNANNQLENWKNLQKNRSTKFSLNYTQYFETNTTKDLPHSVCDGSNVYTFVPDNGSKNLLPYDKVIPSVQSASGPLIWEVNQEINTDSCPINITLRLYKPINDNDIYNNFIEIQPRIGPLPKSHLNSISLSVITDLNTGNNFTTYTSGIYPMPRTYKILQSLQENFYPLVGRVSIEDKVEQIKLVLATQRPMGITANEGKIETLVHRRIPLWYDPRGDDDSVINDSMFVGIISSEPMDILSLHAMEHMQSPISVHVGILETYKDWTTQCATSWTTLSQSFPQTVHLLSMELLETAVTVSSNIVIGIRLFSISNTVEAIDITNAFIEWNIQIVHETTHDFSIVISSVVENKISLSPMKLSSYAIQLMPKHP